MRVRQHAGLATDRELVVVAAVLRAGSEKEAAHRLGLSHSTVKHHLANARSKVGATTTAQLVWILGPRLPDAEGEAVLDHTIDSMRADREDRILLGTGPTRLREVPMSDHFDAEDSRTDLTDLYVFQSPERLDRSVLILNFNPDATAAEVSFDPAASYEIKIDTDGDLEADVAFHVVFETAADDEARATVYRATGAAARGTGRVGEAIVVGARVLQDGSAPTTVSTEYRFFAGLRSDPHFKDVHGFRNNFQFTGDDPVARRNVFGVALEVPNETLGGASVRLWARAMTLVHGKMQQVDQAGRPGINNTFNEPEPDRLAFDESQPAEQWGRFGDRFTAHLESLGYPPDEAHQLARGLLPDMLDYRPAEPAGYPNGRRLTDDTADVLLSLLTRGRITSDLVGPHTDLLAEFPFLGLPHPPDEAATHVE